MRLFQIVGSFYCSTRAILFNEPLCLRLVGAVVMILYVRISWDAMAEIRAPVSMVENPTLYH